MVSEKWFWVREKSGNFIFPDEWEPYKIFDCTLISCNECLSVCPESLAALVLDVKCGRAAFATSIEDARYLAQTLVDTAEGLGIDCTALITQMDHPIGKTIGNSLEVAESIQCLHGEGPEDLEELVCLQGITNNNDMDDDDDIDYDDNNTDCDDDNDDDDNDDVLVLVYIYVLHDPTSCSFNNYLLCI